MSALTAIMVMFATFTTVALNWRLARENKVLRKAETSPRVVAYLAINPRAYGAIDFVLKNVGKGAATNVSYKVASGGDDFNVKDIRMLPPSIKYALLPQGDQLTSSMGMGWDLLKEPKLKAFEVEVSYEDLAGIEHLGRFKLDVTQFEGLGRLGEPFDEQIADSLRKILGVMEGWSHRRLQVEAMSVTERKQHDREIRDRMEEQRPKGANVSKPAPGKAA